MNNLSWLLYLGDVADHFGIICVFLDLFIFCYIVLGSGLMSIMEENIRFVPHAGKLITVFFYNHIYCWCYPIKADRLFNCCFSDKSTNN